MLYSTVEIRPNILNNMTQSWRVTYYDVPHERENVQSKPSAFGFYHYKRSLCTQKAFSELKLEMIKSRFDTITKLQKEIESLSALELK